MYIKYVTAGNTANYTTVFSDIKAVLAGTITTPSELNADFCNRELSEISGTLPTAGIYSVYNPGTTALSFQKKHYDYQNAGFTSNVPATNFTLNVNTGSQGGLSLIAKDKSNANQINGSNTTGGTSTGSFNSIGSGWTAWTEIHFYFGDTAVMVAGLGPTASTIPNKVSYMNIFCDFPLIPDYDVACINTVNNYYPGAGFWSAGWSPFNFGTASSQSSINYFDMLVGRHNYRKGDGTFGTTTIASGGGNSYHYGYLLNATTFWDGVPTLHPSPRRSIPFTQTSTGQATMLIPVMYGPSLTGSNASAAGNLDDTREGQMLGLYRVADNFGTQGIGDRIQIGSDFYRVFKPHRTGYSNMAAAYNTACYAIPENSITGPV